MNLTESTFLLYAMKHYDNPQCTEMSEFEEDIKRFQYLRKLFSRYRQDEDLKERLILNHLIVIFNVFGAEAALNMLQVKLDKEHWSTIKPFLVFLKYIRNDQLTGIEMDQKVVEVLRKI